MVINIRTYKEKPGSKRTQAFFMSFFAFCIQNHLLIIPEQ